jgi:hypothetical protein
MFPHQIFLSFGSVSLLVLCMVAPGMGQNPKNARENRERLSATGKLRDMKGGAIQLVTEEAETWAVKLPGQKKDITYNAATDVDFLRPGLNIRFSADINRKGEVVSTIGSIMVFTPLEARDIGLTPEGAVGENPLENLFVEKEESNKPKKGPEQLPFTVGGKIVSIKGNKMLVAAGNTSLKCELAENVKVNISVADLSFAQPGDTVEVDGWYYAGMKQWGAQANRVTITAANPLIDPKKKGKTVEATPEKQATEEKKAVE